MNFDQVMDVWSYPVQVTLQSVLRFLLGPPLPWIMDVHKVLSSLVMVLNVSLGRKIDASLLCFATSVSSTTAASIPILTVRLGDKGTKELGASTGILSSEGGQRPSVLSSNILSARFTFRLVFDLLAELVLDWDTFRNVCH